MGSDARQAKIVAASPLFEAGWYLRRYPDVAGSGLDPAQHYLRIGGALRRDPGPGFAAAAYCAAYPEAAGGNPLVYFETHGRAAGHDPCPGGTPLASTRARPPAVDVVVPVFNAPGDVRTCLRALAETPTAVALKVLVVDDGSEAETADWLDAGLSELANNRVDFSLIRHPENRGYTCAVNTGLARSTAPFVVTLNSDTIVTPGWADGLIRCLSSDPALGICGPLSNAASWQNVPELWAPGGGFAVNPLPSGLSPAEMGALVRRAAPHPRYPRSPFVNGFCMMISRAVLDAVGLMDEARFPTGYGEENDFCIRAQEAGFALAYAEDVFVFHAKSKSFGQTRRAELSEAGMTALRDKHGSDRVDALIARVADAGEMDMVRGAIRRHLAARARADAPGAPDLLLTQKILFLLPVGAGGGGGHSVIQEASAMRALGVEARVAVGDFAYREFLATYADIPELETLLVSFRPETLLALAQGFDVVVATLYSTVEQVAEIAAACPQILPAYYAQDYEPLFFAPGSPDHAEAAASYTRLTNLAIFAKTDWIRAQIETHHAMPVAKVSPSLDHDVYHAGERIPRGDGPLRLTAMIRPGTPRRGAARTMELFQHLHDLHGDRVAITIFGCAPDDPGLQGLAQAFPHENAGVITRPQVADLLRKTDLFIDLSDYQAFGRTALEAMACGATALVPQAGGSDEYALDGINALICDTTDLARCLTRIAALLADPGQVQNLQLAAIETAAAYDPRRAALSELTVLARALAAHRRDSPKTEPVSSPPAAAPAPALTVHPPPAFEGGDPLTGAALTLPSGPDATPPDPAPDIGVHLHMHYPELLPEIETHLNHIPVPFSLYVSTHATWIDRARTSLTKAVPQATLDIRSFPNRGRDIGPFVSGFGPELSGHELICHIHSKRSPQNSAKYDWRRQLLGTILGSPAGVAEILRLFAETPRLGLVYPEFHWSLADQIDWGTNFQLSHDLAARLGFAVTQDHLTLFPAGCMFWIRSAAMRPLFDLNLGFDEFPEEARQYDGTLAHAIERILGQLMIETGFGQMQVRASTGARDDAA